MQIVEDVMMEEDTTLETDDSSKYGKQYGAFTMRVKVADLMYWD